MGAHPRATREWQLMRPCRKLTRLVCPVLRLIPCWSLGFRLVLVFEKYFLQVFSETVGDTPGKRRWSCLEPG